MGKKGGGVRVKQIGGPKGGMNPSAMNPQKMMQEAMGDMMKSGMNNKALMMPQIPDDRSVLQKWPLNRSCQNEPHDKWQVVWPSNLDSNKTTKEGRKVGKTVGLPKPTLSDISEALQKIGIRHAIEPYKFLPRDPASKWDNFGRVRVELKTYLDDDDPDPIPVHPEISCKNDLYKVLCREIGKLDSRKVRLEVERRKALQEEEERKKEEAERIKEIKAKGADKKQGSNSKKKGKKKK
ncbi:hypothetical protein TrST_g8287 [Triparma strigata]|uniref:Uncharacterized protein n=1 Tax=Triparma strigata TaxID=1606541 RepID=A0A9W6ZSL1_9STRA|nr:hypothetical protein TrST_g8287 [Triparma strigata]